MGKRGRTIGIGRRGCVGGPHEPGWTGTVVCIMVLVGVVTVMRLASSGSVEHSMW